MVELEADVSELIALSRRCDGAQPIVREELRTAGHDAGFAMVNAARIEAPAITGNLRRRIGPPEIEVVGSGVRVEVIAHADYAAAVHDGRRAVEIVPVSKRALRFEVGGAVVFARRVFQPARAGNPFFERAKVRVRGQVDRFFAEATVRASRRILGGT